MEKKRSKILLSAFIISVGAAVVNLVGMILMFCDKKYHYNYSYYYRYSNSYYEPNPEAGIMPLFAFLLVVASIVIIVLMRKKKFNPIPYYVVNVLAQLLLFLSILLVGDGSGYVGYYLCCGAGGSIGISLILVIVYQILGRGKKEKKHYSRGGLQSDMKNKTIAGVLAIVFGIFSIHIYYLGDNKRFIKRLLLLLIPLSASIITFISFIEGIKLIAMDQTEFDELYNDGKCSSVPLLLNMLLAENAGGYALSTVVANSDAFGKRDNVDMGSYARADATNVEPTPTNTSNAPKTQLVKPTVTPSKPASEKNGVSGKCQLCGKETEGLYRIKITNGKGTFVRLLCLNCYTEKKLKAQNNSTKAVAKTLDPEDQKKTVTNNKIVINTEREDNRNYVVPKEDVLSMDIDLSDVGDDDSDILKR